MTVRLSTATLRIFSALIVGAALLVGCQPSSAPPETPAFGSGPGAPTLSQISDLLNRHANAVRSKSIKAFLSDVDPAQPSAAFRALQTVSGGALANVPLRTWTYAIYAPVNDAATVKAAAVRLKAPATIVHLTLTYAYSEVDPDPISHDLWWTFVQRKGLVYIADDTDMAGLGGASWRGPWDFGPLVVRRGAASLVIGHPANADELPALVADVDAAVPAVSAVWGAGWAQVVAVVVPQSDAEFAALSPSGAGSAALLANISAETLFESSNVGSEHLIGARVVVNPAMLSKLTSVGRRIVLQHEITHVAAAASTVATTPRWLIEGFADYVGNLGSGQPVKVAAAELGALVRASRLPTALPSDTAFRSTATNLPAVYEQAWLACRFIAQRWGQDGLVRLYRLVGANPYAGPTALVSAFQDVLHESLASFVPQWRSYLIGQLS